MKDKEEIIKIFTDIVTSHDGFTAKICILSGFPVMYVRMSGGCMYLKKVFSEKEYVVNPDNINLAGLRVLLNDLRDPFKTTYYKTEYLNKLERGEF